MRNDTKVLLVAGGTIYILTVGAGDLLLRTAAAAGAYAGTRIIAGDDLKRAIEDLNLHLEGVPDEKRKAAIEAVKAKLERDEGTLQLAAFAVGAGAFFNPLVSLAVCGVWAAKRWETANKETAKELSRLEKMGAFQDILNNRKRA